MPDFLPRRDGQFLAWSANFDRMINESPELYGISVELAEDYRTHHQAFANAYQLSTQPTARTPNVVLIKDRTRAAVMNLARRLAKHIGAQIGTTAQMKQALGLRIRKTQTPIDRPAAAPQLFVRPTVEQNAVRVRIFDPASPTRIAKPKHVRFAVLYSFVGDEPADDIRQWEYRGAVTRTTTRLNLAPAVPPAARIWVAAAWVNAKGQRGPLSVPASARNSGGFAKAEGVRAA